MRDLAPVTSAVAFRVRDARLAHAQCADLGAWEASSHWGRAINKFSTAWDVVARADCPKEVFNDDYQQLATEVVAHRAYRSAVGWPTTCCTCRACCRHGRGREPKVLA